MTRQARLRRAERAAGAATRRATTPPGAAWPRAAGTATSLARANRDAQGRRRTIHRPVPLFCCAPFALLRPFTLHCTRKRGVAERKGRSRAKGAQQRVKGRSRRRPAEPGPGRRPSPARSGPVSMMVLRRWRPPGPAPIRRCVGAAEKGGRRVSFGCAAAPTHPGSGVIAPFRDGRGAGWGVKDMRRPPFWVAGPSACWFARACGEAGDAGGANGAGGVDGVSRMDGMGRGAGEVSLAALEFAPGVRGGRTRLPALTARPGPRRARAPSR